MRFLLAVAVLFVAAVTVVDAASLSVPNEFSSIGAALSKARAGDTIWVDDGVYRERIVLSPNVVLKARRLHKAVIDGKGRGTAVTLAPGATIEGFEVRNGTVGILSKSGGARVLMCLVVRNSQSGVTCVGHLPDLRDNIIAFNGGSGIQGWDLRSTSSTIAHNTVAYNGNHGIALGGVSDIIIENCIIAFNTHCGVKAESPTVQARVTHTNLYGNGMDTTPLSEGNMSTDPLFVEGRRGDFRLQAGSRCIGAGGDNEDIGARLISSSQVSPR